MPEEIWKFALRGWLWKIEMPKGARVISAGVQGDEIVVWAECLPGAEREERVFAAVNTGDPLPLEAGSRAFIGTVQVAPRQGPAIVWHIYELLSDS